MTDSNPIDPRADASGMNRVAAPRISNGRGRGRWSRLCLKELRETLRDRRTLVTLFLMPLLVYPVLSMVLQKSLLSAWSPQRASMILGVESEQDAEELRQLLIRNARFEAASELAEAQAEQAEAPGESGGPSAPLPSAPPPSGPPETGSSASSGSQAMHSESKQPPPASQLVQQQLAPLLGADNRIDVDTISFFVHEDLAGSVRDEEVDLGVRNAPGKPGEIELIYREQAPLSLKALRYLEGVLHRLNEESLRERLRRVGQSGRLALQGRRHGIVTKTPDTALSTIVPMILILMTVTGAVYPAIDLTAGERERGTLEMLMASPVPRLRLLLAKYVAVVTVAMLTAIVNLTAMTITLYATGLSRTLLGESGLGLLRVVEILALLALFAAFFSAILLALTSFARSFKEAQAYLIPLMLLSLGPGIVSLLPGLELRGLLAITPISNMVLLARDLCGDGADPLMALVATLSTSLYTLAAIGIAARIFGADAVLSGGRTQWQSVLSFANTTHRVSSVGGAMFCLAVLFPIYFMTSNGLAQLHGFTLPVRLVISGLATSILFGVIPWVASRWQGIDAVNSFQLHPPSPWRSLPICLVLGLTLWPLAHEIFYLNQFLGLASIRPDQFKAVEQLLADWRDISPFWILLAMAVSPAVFEEFFFRGYLFSAFRSATGKWNTIVATSLIFGLFHVVSSSALSTERMLPSTFLGFVLGWVCYRTSSIFAGIVLHASHNGLLLMIAYYKDELAARGWGVEENSHLPASWIAISTVVLVLGITSIGWRSPPEQTTAEGESMRP